jgi:tetratricopeptide (TPR) repeat protein
VANEAESRAALRWGREAGWPGADRLAVALAVRISDLGLVADAIELLGPLGGTPTGDREVDALAAAAEAYVLFIRGDPEAALERILAAPEAPDPGTQATVLVLHSFLRTAAGDTAGGVEDMARALALAREADDVALAGMFLLAAQAHLYHDDFDGARAHFAAAERENRRRPAQLMASADTFRGDVAMRLGRPEEALEPYARSLSAAEARGNQLQVLFDLAGIAAALAGLGRDREATEAAGLAEAQGREVASAEASFMHLLGDAAVVAAAERLGPAAEELRAKGRAVPAGRRVAAACALALAASSASPVA